MIASPSWEVFPRPRYIDGKFDRRAFNPANPSHDITLRTLRRIGASRLHYFENGERGLSAWHDLNDHFRCCGSTALKALIDSDFLEIRNRQQVECTIPNCSSCREVYLDIGSGHSPDVLIAAKLGYQAHSVDLFPAIRGCWPVSDEMKAALDRHYVQADGLELPFADCSVDYISSQAMIALVEPKERLAFYREVRRVLKIGGAFSMTGAILKCGYHFSQATEHDRALKIDWQVYCANAGFVAQKETA